jgi:hypothetical protein
MKKIAETFKLFNCRDRLHESSTLSETLVLVAIVCLPYSTTNAIAAIARVGLLKFNILDMCKVF